MSLMDDTFLITNSFALVYKYIIFYGLKILRYTDKIRGDNDM